MNYKLNSNSYSMGFQVIEPLSKQGIGVDTSKIDCSYSRSYEKAIIDACVEADIKATKNYIVNAFAYMIDNNLDEMLINRISFDYKCSFSDMIMKVNSRQLYSNELCLIKLSDIEALPEDIKTEINRKAKP